MSTKVLVIEDDLEINELVGEYLALENITYLKADKGREGIQLALQNHPDAIILDLMLPDITGFEVANTLTNQRATYDIPIVILSCLCDKQKGFAAGASYYMTKPFLPDDLLVMLRKALEWKSSLQTRPAEGSITLGPPPDASESAINIHQMITALFAHTSLDDAAIHKIREAIDLLAQWVIQWNSRHFPRSLRIDYRITPAKSNTQASIEWKLSEDAPGVLADAFFKSPPAAPANLISWGTATPAPTTPLAPPAQWLQILLKTGSAKFQRDLQSRTIRFSRLPATAPLNPNTTPVPIDDLNQNLLPIVASPLLTPHP